MKSRNKRRDIFWIKVLLMTLMSSCFLNKNTKMSNNFNVFSGIYKYIDPLNKRYNYLETIGDEKLYVDYDEYLIFYPDTTFYQISLNKRSDNKYTIRYVKYKYKSNGKNKFEIILICNDRRCEEDSVKIKFIENNESESLKMTVKREDNLSFYVEEIIIISFKSGYSDGINLDSLVYDSLQVSFNLKEYSDISIDVIKYFHIYYNRANLRGNIIVTIPAKYFESTPEDRFMKAKGKDQIFISYKFPCIMCEDSNKTFLIANRKYIKVGDLSDTSSIPLFNKIRK
jgi:hypothetical protein